MTANLTHTKVKEMPQHRLVAYQIAKQLLVAVMAARVADAKLRDEALRAAKGCCLNIAEAAGRSSLADRARTFTIARGEACEVAAALEIAALTGSASLEAAREIEALASRLYGLLTGLVNKAG